VFPPEVSPASVLPGSAAVCKGQDHVLHRLAGLRPLGTTNPPEPGPPGIAGTLPVVSCLVTKDSEGVTAAGRGNRLAMQIRHDWKSVKAAEGEGTGNMQIRCYNHCLQSNILIKIPPLGLIATSCPGSVYPEQSSSPSKQTGSV